MALYTTHSLLECARDFDSLFSGNLCEFAHRNRELNPYTVRFDPSTHMGTVLCSSSIAGIHFSLPGFMPVLDVKKGGTPDAPLNGVKYYVGEHGAFTSCMDEFGFPLSVQTKSTYGDGIKMLEKTENLTFIYPAITRHILDIMSFMFSKREDGCFWLSDNGIRIFSRGLGIEAVWEGTNVDNEFFYKLPIHAIYYLCTDRGFAMAQDDKQFVFKDMSECPRFIYVDKASYPNRRSNFFKPQYFMDGAEFQLKISIGFPVHIPECGTQDDAKKCDTVTLSPSGDGKLMLTFQDPKGNVVKTVECDDPFPSCLDKPLKTMARQQSICAVFMRGFEGTISLAKDQEDMDYLVLETTCRHPATSDHPLTALTDQDRSVHIRMVINVK